jgi:hypothetical protein
MIFLSDSRGPMKRTRSDLIARDNASSLLIVPQSCGTRFSITYARSRVSVHCRSPRMVSMEPLRGNVASEKARDGRQLDSFSPLAIILAEEKLKTRMPDFAPTDRRPVMRQRTYAEKGSLEAVLQWFSTLNHDRIRGRDPVIPQCLFS